MSSSTLALVARHGIGAPQRVVRHNASQTVPTHVRPAQRSGNILACNGLWASRG